ncbi:uncharacterized protein Z520_05374 [Fonsecaea multimorphosa CBS 102226]|uniref:C2H2-type domain-containing protein n=1 Tax=Fonsecaea multimorphosa CBS 102226 TaxID=1442371 RepID=A0A0D2KQH1_9EURO|nr:uncharacterized protein Z520_05374 [Fonsecaea multimorphosa CBS 102226]KIX98913.1 hypothetical protein Z520_05374 [Fonsecaea multimorphosa CBS 102226]OAL25188.1 hypothetical protein AYO22_05065 [Fonsecaea multimorphosa]
MHYHSHYQDLLESQGPEYVYGDPDGHGTPTQYWYNHGDFHSINPLLESFSPHDMSSHYQRPGDLQLSCASYDPIAQGFSHRSLWETADRVLPQLDGFDPDRSDIDHFRHLRHPSPTDPLGFALSSNSDSSVSDYALSPEAARSSLHLHFTHSPPGFGAAAMATSSLVDHSWNPQPLFMPHHPSTPMSANHTVPSMKHLQVTPDPEHDDEPVDVKETYHPKINFPVELELSEPLISPPDSGLDQSVHDDDIMKDEEEDSEVTETENDAEFLPKRNATRRPHGTPRRHSLREPRHPKAVIDPSARVRKPAPACGASHNGNSRSKNKKKPPAVKKNESDAKHFPCAFHHYGCYATFGNKNEWKRHVSSQHLQLGYYRCDMGACSPETARNQHRGFNDFNRKDLFTQHCRRMHAPWSGSKKGEEGVLKKERENFEKELEEIRARCWVDRRKGPQKTKCGFCGKKFVDGKESRGWDERMEHVGRHFERDHMKIKDEEVDEGLKQWAINEGIVREGKKRGEFWLVGFEPAQSSRRSQGQRRSRRLIKEEKVEQEDEESHSNDDHEDDDDDDDTSDRETTDVQSMKTDEDDEEEGAGSDADAEAEDE